MAKILLFLFLVGLHSIGFATTSSSFGGSMVTIKQSTVLGGAANKKSYLTVPNAWKGYVLQGVGNVVIEESQLIQIPAFPNPQIDPSWSIAKIEAEANRQIAANAEAWKDGVMKFLDEYHYEIVIADVELKFTHAGKPKTLVWNLLIQWNKKIDWNPPKLLDDDGKPKQLYIHYLPAATLPDIPPSGDMIFNDPAAGKLIVEERDDQFNLIQNLGAISIGDLNDRPTPETAPGARSLDAGFQCLIDSLKGNCAISRDIKTILADQNASRAILDYTRIAIPGNKATAHYEADVLFDLKTRKTRVNVCNDQSDFQQQADYTIYRMQRITERFIVYPNGKFERVNRFQEDWQIPKSTNQSTFQGNLFSIKAPQCKTDEGYLLPRVAYGYPQPKNRLVTPADAYLPPSSLVFEDAEFEPYVPDGYYKVPGKKMCCPFPSRWDDGAGQCTCDTVDQFGHILSSAPADGIGTGQADIPYTCGGNDTGVGSASGACKTVCVPQTCAPHELFNEASCQCEAAPACTPVGTAPTGSSWNIDRCTWVCADGSPAPTTGCAPAPTPTPDTCKPSGATPSGAHWDSESCQWACSDGHAAPAGGCPTHTSCAPTTAQPGGSFWSDIACEWMCMDGSIAPITGCDSAPGACPAHSCPTPYKPVGSNDKCEKIVACEPGTTGKGYTWQVLYDSRRGSCGYGSEVKIKDECDPFVCPLGTSGPYGPMNTCCKHNQHWNGSVCEADGPELLATLAGCSYSGIPGIDAITVKTGVAQTARWCGGQHYVRFVWDGHNFTVTDTGLDCHTCPIKGTQYEIEVWLN